MEREIWAIESTITLKKIICGKLKLSRMKLTTESSSLDQDVRKTSQND